MPVIDSGYLCWFWKNSVENRQWYIEEIQYSETITIIIQMDPLILMTKLGVTGIGLDRYNASLLTLVP